MRFRITKESEKSKQALEKVNLEIQKLSGVMIEMGFKYISISLLNNDLMILHFSFNI